MSDTRKNNDFHNNFELGKEHPKVSQKRLMNCRADVNQLQPIKYHWAYEDYQKAVSNFWIPQKVNMNVDRQQWRSSSFLNSQERRIVEMNLGFFSTADSLVANNIVLAVYKHITNPECRLFLLTQVFQEAVHTDSYNYIISALGMDNEHIFNMYNTVPSVANKDAWALQFINSFHSSAGNQPTNEELLINLCAFYLVFEGIFFYAGFAQILALGFNGKMTGTVDQFRYILKDESLHFTFGIKLINGIIQENPELWTIELQEKVRLTIKQGTELEIAYSDDVMMGFPEGAVLAMNAKDNRQYLQYIANIRCQQIGLEPVFPKSVQPFQWMDNMLNLSTSVNFFERTNTNYSVGGLVDDL